MLRFKDFTYRISGKILLDSANVTIPSGHKVGFVGRNGVGKTTVLKLITGHLSPSGGEIIIPQNWKIGITTQDPPGGDRSLIDTVLAANKELYELKQLADNDKQRKNLSEIHERLNILGAQSAEAKASKILAGLGFRDHVQLRPCSEFSGGWRMRVALAALLFLEPDLLLLDEPTNHLDLESALWLEDFLLHYPGTLLVVSHDRHLLNRVVQEILHLENRKMTLYSGNYDTFENTRRIRAEHDIKNRKKVEAERAHIQDFVNRFRYKASKAKQAQSRLKKLERMEPVSAAQTNYNRNLVFPKPVSLASPLLTLEKVDVGYNDKPVLRDINIRLDSDDRIALVGANGNGKSTLVKLLAGQLSPIAGQITKSNKLRIGYFAQHQTDELNINETPINAVSRIRRKESETQIRSYLSYFGFDQARAETKIAHLSGGEKARLLFSLMSCDRPHVLLLDEPTNHLDMDYRQALIQAINCFEGAILIVSHDPNVIELTADHFWIVQNGRVSEYDGDIADYRKLLISTRGHKTVAKLSSRSQPSRKEQRRNSAKRRESLAPLKNAIINVENLIENFNKERKRLHIVMTDPTLFEGNSDMLVSLQKQLGLIEKNIKEAEETWIKLQEDYEWQQKG